MPISLDEFVRSLTETGILPPAEVTSLVSSLPEDRTGVDVEQIARELVKQQKITRFQASVIFRRQSRGLRIGEYIVLDKIGSGGMGQVFKAEDRRTGQNVALKLLRASYTKSQRAISRFYREANTAARLRHRNLVAVNEAGEWNGLHYLVMELIHGRDVRSIVKDKGRLLVPEALDVILQSARGLAYAHTEGVVHRDIKPANLLRDHAGRVVVLDLGLARLDDAAQEAAGEDGGRLTMAGNFLGTLDYVSPEQALDAHEVDGRSDIYSLGCTLHYLLTGGPPYRRESAPLILAAHCQDPIPDLSHIRGMAPRLNAVFQRMLAKKPHHRFASMAELVVELEYCRRELAGQQVPPLAPPQPPAAESESESGHSTADTTDLAATIEFNGACDVEKLFPAGNVSQGTRYESTRPETGSDPGAGLTDTDDSSPSGGSDPCVDIGASTASEPFESLTDLLQDPLSTPAGAARRPGSALTRLAAAGMSFAGRLWSRLRRRG